MPSQSPTPASRPANTPEANELLDRARTLLPLVRTHAERNNQQRDVAPEVVAALKEAGLFKLLQPAAWGGYEASPLTFYGVQNLIAEACASTAWIYGVLSVQSFILALMDRQAQADVWGEDSNTLMSSSFQPVGKVQPVDGGYRISGRWTFSSGSSHARWVLVGSLVPPAAEGQPPHMRLFLVPRADYEIVDTWHTIGLRGTGSNDIAIDDVFVPAYRTHQPSPGIVPTTGAGHLAPLHRLPWLYMFTSTVSNLGIGMGRAALNTFIAIERERVSILTGKAAKEDPAVHSAAARLSAEIAAMEAMYQRHIGNMMELIERNEAMSMTDGLMQRTQLTSALRRIAAIVDDMQQLLGGRGIRLDSGLVHIWLDLCAARAHPGNDPGMIAPAYGKSLLDQPAGN